jgi:DNA processing protein
MNEGLYRLAWLRIPGCASGALKALVSHFGSAEEAWKASIKELRSTPNSTLRLNGLSAANREKALVEAAEWQDLNEKSSVKTLFYGTPEYPYLLSKCVDAPAVLFSQGNFNPSHPRIVSVIGTRKATDQGIQATRSIVKTLSEYGASIVSGLAYGIDITAHRQAMEEGAHTVAILGSGLGNIYPALHRKEARAIAEKGALISEFHYKASPDRENFPTRNRIIAGMAHAVIVVEAGAEGGAWITARFANDYNREVLAVPGGWDKPFSLGCNRLIGRHLAAILPAAEEIPFLLGWDRPLASEQNQNPQIQLFPPSLGYIEDVLKENKDPMSFDELSVRTQTNAPSLQSALFELELKGLIRSLPGRYIALCR